MVIRKLVGAAVLGVAMVMGACAHMDFKPPDDPVEEARLRLSAIAEAPGDVVCAAERVERELSLEALRSNKLEQPPGGDPYHTWAERQARRMNLSQASAQISAALANEKAAADARHKGVPGASLRSRSAMGQFDAAYGAATSSAVARRGKPTRAEESWARAHYAIVWSEFFDTSEGGEDRDQLLDWLTTRSMQNLEVLRRYHEEFAGALEHACG